MCKSLKHKKYHFLAYVAVQGTEESPISLAKKYVVEECSVVMKIKGHTLRVYTLSLLKMKLPNHDPVQISQHKS